MTPKPDEEQQTGEHVRDSGYEVSGRNAIQAHLAQGEYQYGIRRLNAVKRKLLDKNVGVVRGGDFISASSTKRLVHVIGNMLFNGLITLGVDDRWIRFSKRIDNTEVSY